MRPLRPCSYPGCPELVHSGRCAKHQPRDKDQGRPSAHRRGYDRAWQRIRAAVLREEPMCRECGQAKATEVDHIDGDPWNRERSNLRPMCKPCHSRRTARDQAFGKTQPAAKVPARRGWLWA